MSESRHATRVRILQSVLGKILAGARSDLYVAADELWVQVAEAVEGVDFGERKRHETRMLIQYAGTYIDLFTPDDSWTLDRSPDGQLVWQRGGERVADFFVLRTADTNAWARQDRAGARQALRDGRDEFGDQFLGVRVLFPIRPARSLWLSDHRQPPVPLGESGLWEADQTPQDLRAALVSEARS